MSFLSAYSPFVASIFIGKHSQNFKYTKRIVAYIGVNSRKQNVSETANREKHVAPDHASNAAHIIQSSRPLYSVRRFVSNTCYWEIMPVFDEKLHRQVRPDI